MNIKSLLVKLLPQFFKMATQIWFSHSPAQRAAATSAVKAVEWLKNAIGSYDAAYLAGQANKLFNINMPVAKISSIQDRIKVGLSDVDYNRVWKDLAEDITQDITPEPIDWKQFAFGLIQIAYEEIIKK